MDGSYNQVFLPICILFVLGRVFVLFSLFENMCISRNKVCPLIGYVKMFHISLLASYDLWVARKEVIFLVFSQDFYNLFKFWSWLFLLSWDNKRIVFNVVSSIILLFTLKFAHSLCFLHVCVVSQADLWLIKWSNKFSEIWLESALYLKYHARNCMPFGARKINEWSAHLCSQSLQNITCAFYIEKLILSLQDLMVVVAYSFYFGLSILRAHLIWMTERCDLIW